MEYHPLDFLRGQKGVSNGGAASVSKRSKRMKLSVAPVPVLSKAEQTILQGAAEFFRLRMDQLFSAVDHYRSQPSISSGPNSGQPETPSVSFHPAGWGRSAPSTHGSYPDTSKAPFPLALPHLSSRPHRVTHATTSGVHDSPVRNTRPAEDLQLGHGAVPWPSNQISDDIQNDWNSCMVQYGHSQRSKSEEDTYLPSSNFDLNFDGAGHHRTEPPRQSSDLMPLIPALVGTNVPDSFYDSDHTSGFGVLPHGKDLTSAPPPQAPAAHETSNTYVPDNSQSPPRPARVSQKRKRGPFKDLNQREETGLVRNIGACIRCRLQRIRCRPNPTNLNGCCLTCSQASRSRIHWVPCLRYKITDANLLDHGQCPRDSWTLRWKSMEMKDITTWASTKVKDIDCTQDVSGAVFRLRVRKFIPIEGDSLARKWCRNGVQKSYECPPYAIADMEEAAITMTEFARKSLGSAICSYIDETDTLLRSTYQMAYRQSKMASQEEERRLLVSVLELWAASRIACASDRICGSETLGMKPRDYGREDSNSGIILTPPVFSAQLEIIVTAKLLIPARDDVLARINKLVRGKERRSWFVIYLTMFVLMHNCALLTRGDNKKARKQGMKSRYFRTSLVESLHHGTKVLLAYFHYSNKGSYPFTMDWSVPGQVACMDFDQEQGAFMRQTVEAVEEKREMFQKIKRDGDFEHDYYFISQLYDANWKPIHTI